MSSSVLILGAAGRLGQQLGLAFARAGWRTLAQSRKALPPALNALPGLEHLAHDAFASDALRQAARGVNVVVNALNPPYADWDRLALPLAAAAQDLALQLDALLMLPGNVYNFGRELPQELRVDTPEQGNTSKAVIRIEIEKRMASAADAGLRSVVLRAGDFFGGDGRGSWFDLALASRLHQGRFVYPGPLDRRHAWAYLPDLAESFVRIAQLHPRLIGHKRLHFAGHAVEGQVLRQSLLALCQRELRPATLPWPLIRLAAPLVPSWRAIAEMRYLWERPHQLVDESLQGLIGPVPHTPLPEALHQALLALKSPALPKRQPLLSATS